MKPKTTLVLLLTFLILLGAVLLFESKSKARQEDKEKEKTFVDLKAADIKQITLKKEDETITFVRDEKGDWLITEPLEAKADSSEVNRLVDDFSSLKFDRLVDAEGDPTRYEIPKKELTLWAKGREQPVKILVGMENPLDSSLFAKREDEPRIVLLSSGLKSDLDKTVFDFRQKEIFKFDPEDVAAVKLKAKDISWRALKKEEEWYLESPVKALAKKSRIDDVLRTLSGLRAKEFVVEQKKDTDISEFGLKDAEYIVTLNLPVANQEIVFSLHKHDDTVYVTTSLSTKIVTAEETVLSNIEKNIEDLREKQVLVFNSWEASRLRIRRGDLMLSVGKDGEGNWRFDDAGKGEADRSKIETFIRKLESLEAVEFIDSPSDLKAYGLAEPQAEATVLIKAGEKETEYTIQIGREDAAKNQLIVRNPSLGYLFRVDAAFLNEFPKAAEDWKPLPPAKSGPETDKPKETSEKD
jgi:cell division protein FtsL